MPAKIRILTLLHRVLLLGLVLFVPAMFAADDGPAPSESEGIIAFLNQSILWYRQTASQQQFVTSPNDAVIFNENHQNADQVVRLSFDFARARAQTLAADTKARGAAPNQEPAAPQSQGLSDLARKTDDQAKQTQQELAGLKQQVTTASGQQRRILESRVAEVQSELDLLHARQDILHGMLDFTSSAASSSAKQSGLPAQIEALTRALPAAATELNPAAGDSNAAAAAVAAAASERKEESSGIYALLSQVLATRKKLNALDATLEMTDSLVQTAKTLRAPLVAHARELTHRGDELANQPDSLDPAVLAQQRQELDGLTAQFKQSAAAILPLGKQNILLDLFKRNLATWQNAVQVQYFAEKKRLLWHLAVLAVVLAIVFLLSEVWRRVTFRYVEDPHRRQQFLLLRRIAVTLVVMMVIVFAFANGLGGVPTFAGLLTAGVAVSLQNVILAVAGYFFLVGKYGVRVGDRVQVAGVTGEVLDIGLIRLHMMEISGSPVPRPTGRVVAFSNAAVFQPAGIFKQIPGTTFLWHEIALTLPPTSNYARVEKTMVETVNKIFAEYRDQIEGQRSTVSQTLSTATVDSFDPQSRLSLTQEGLQIIVRYAVDLTNAAEIDDRVIREVLKATGREPHLQPSDAQPAGPAPKKKNNPPAKSK